MNLIELLDLLETLHENNKYSHVTLGFSGIDHMIFDVEGRGLDVLALEIDTNIELSRMINVIDDYITFIEQGYAPDYIDNDTPIVLIGYCRGQAVLLTEELLIALFNFPQWCKE